MAGAAAYGLNATQSAAVTVTAPRLGWLGATSAVVGSDTVAAPGSTVALVPPAGAKLLLRVDTEASTLGDLTAELVRPGHGVDPAFAARVKASGIRVIDADDLVELRALGISKPPAPPRSPVPARGGNPDPDG